MDMINSEQLIEITPVSTEIITVTPSALTVIQNLLQQRNIPNHCLRVFVTGGGCSGLQYGMSFDPAPQEYDKVVSYDDVRILIDPTSLVYLQGAVIDFVDSLIGGGFRIENPNAVSSCGCGTSFKGKDSSAETSSSGGCGSCSSNSSY
jgi:iron-sulfur cluster assembly accessory protein